MPGITDDTHEDATSTYREYILDVRVVERHPSDADDPVYEFHAPEHQPVGFEDPEMAALYADVYFDVNGFCEADTGERGVPPEVIQAGRDTVAAYLHTQSGTDLNWVASFYGKKPHIVKDYLSAVRTRADEIRARATERGIE